MSDDGETLELRMARAAYAAAEQIKKAAEQDRSAAEYDRGQSSWNLKEIQALEANISRREAKLKELNEPAFLEREQAADAKLKQAQELMQAYDRDRHAAALALTAIDKREREAAARAKAA